MLENKLITNAIIYLPPVGKIDRKNLNFEEFDALVVSKDYVGLLFFSPLFGRVDQL